jgi:hypothetical protein
MAAVELSRSKAGFVRPARVRRADAARAAHLREIQTKVGPDTVLPIRLRAKKSFPGW